MAPRSLSDILKMSTGLPQPNPVQPSPRNMELALGKLGVPLSKGTTRGRSQLSGSSGSYSTGQISGASGAGPPGNPPSLLQQLVNEPMNTARGLWEFSLLPPSIAIGTVQAASDLVRRTDSDRRTPWYDQYYGNAMAMGRGIRDWTTDTAIPSLYGGASLSPGLSGAPPAFDKNDPRTQALQGQVDATQRAVDEGRIVEKLVTDVGLIAMFTGGTGAAIGSATRPGALASLTRAGRAGYRRAKPTIAKGAQKLKLPGTNRRIHVGNLDSAEVPVMPSPVIGGGIAGAMLRRGVATNNPKLVTRAEKMGRAGDALQEAAFRGDWFDPGIAVWRGTMNGVRVVAPTAVGRLDRMANLQREYPEHTDTLNWAQRRMRNIGERFLDWETRRNVTSEGIGAEADAQRQVAPIREIATKLGLSKADTDLVTMLASEAYRDIVLQVGRQIEAGRMDEAEAILNKWNSHNRFAGVDVEMLLTLDQITDAWVYMRGGRDAFDAHRSAGDLGGEGSYDSLARVVEVLTEIRKEATRSGVANNLFDRDQALEPELVYNKHGQPVGVENDMVLAHRQERFESLVARRNKLFDDKVSPLEEQVERAGRAVELQRQVAETAPMPGERSGEVSQNAALSAHAQAQRAVRELERIHQDITIELAALTDDYNSLRARIDAGENVPVSERARLKDLEAQTKELRDQAERVRKTQAYRHDTDSMAPRPSEAKDDAGAIVALIDEIHRGELDLIDAEINMYHRLAGVPDVDLPIETWAEAVRVATGDMTISNEQLIRRYEQAQQRRSDHIAGRVDPQHAVELVARYLEMSDEYVAAAYRGGEDWAKYLIGEMSEGVDAAREVVALELGEMFPVPEQLAAALRDPDNGARLVAAAQDAIADNFGELAHVSGFMDGGDSLAAIVRELSADEIIKWIEDGEMPEGIVERLFRETERGSLLSGDQLIGLDKGFEYVREQRTAIASGERRALLTGADEVRVWSRQRAEDAVKQFNEKLSNRIGVNAPQIGLNDLPKVTRIRRRAREIRGDRTGRIRSEIAENAQGVKPQFGEYARNFPVAVFEQVRLGRFAGNQSLPGFGSVAPDQFASLWKNGRFAGDIDAALADYVSDVRQYLDARRVDNPELVREFAEEYGLPDEVIVEALRATATDFHAAYEDSMIEVFKEASTATDGLDDALRTEGAEQVILEALDSTGAGTTAETLHRSGVDYRRLADWILDQHRVARGETLASVAPPIPPESSAALRAALEGRAEAAAMIEEGIPRISEAIVATEKDLRVAAERAGVTQKVAQEQLHRVDDDYWEPGSGRNGRSKGEDAWRQLGSAEQALRFKQGKLEVYLRELRRLDDSIENFDSMLRESKQKQLIDAQLRHVHKVRQAVRSLHPIKLGLFEIREIGAHERTVKKVRLTGEIGRIAHELGLYNEMLEAAETSGIIYRSQGRQNDRVFGSRRDLRNNPTDIVTGESNVVLSMLYDVIDRADRWDLVTDKMRNDLAMASIVDDLDVILTDGATIHSKNLNMMQAAQTAIEARLHDETIRYRFGNRPLGGRIDYDDMAVHISNDYRQAITDAFDAHTAERGRMLQTINDANVAVMPASYRRVAINSRDALRNVLERMEEHHEAERAARRNGDYEKAKVERELANDMARGAQEITTSIFQMLKRGVRPVHITGGPGLRVSPASQLGRAPTQAGMLSPPEIRGAQRMESGIIETNLQAYTNLEMQQAGGMLVRLAMEQFINTPGGPGRALNDLIGDDIAEYQAQYAGRYPNTKDIIDMVRAKGYEIIVGSQPRAMNDIRTSNPPDYADYLDSGRNSATRDPDTLGSDFWEWHLAEKARDADRVPDEMMAMRAVPAAIAKAMDDWLNPSRTSGPVRAFDQLTQVFKVLVLAARPMWFIGNLIGNAIMATATGMTPADIAINIGKVMGTEARFIEAQLGLEAGSVTRMQAVKHIWEHGGTFNAIPGRLQSHNLTHAERNAVRKLSSEEGFLDRTIAKMSDPTYMTERNRARGRPDNKGRGVASVIDGSYRANELVDNLFRSAVFNHQLEKRMPQIKLNEAATLEGQQAADMIRAIEESTEFALGTMGDFSRMTSFERNYIKRFIPFYPWLRHQTRITLRLPINNPLRAAFFSSVYQFMVSDDERGENWDAMFGSSIETPFGRMSLGSAMPMARSWDELPFLPGGDNPARTFNPFIVAATDTFTGTDLAAGDEGSRPLDQRLMTPWNQPEQLAWWKRLRRDPRHAIPEFGYRLADMTPQTALLRDAALTQVPGSGYQGRGSRELRTPAFDSGDAMKYRPRGGGDLARIMRGLGIPFPVDDPDAERRVRLSDIANARR